METNAEDPLPLLPQTIHQEEHPKQIAFCTHTFYREMSVIHPMLERTSLLSASSSPPPQPIIDFQQQEPSSSSSHSGSSQAAQPPPRRGFSGYASSVASFSAKSALPTTGVSSSDNYFSLEKGVPALSSRYSAYDVANVEAGNGSLPPPTDSFHPFSRHRGELSILEKYRYDLSRAQLKASSRTSALLAGFAMVALVELQYEESTPASLLILLGVVTTLLVSVHLLALMMSTCILPYIEANGCTQDSPHIRLKFYIDLSWIFSTCIGLVLFLIEIGVIFFVKFNAVGYDYIGYITTAMLAPVLVVFIVFSCLIHRNRFSHSMDRVDSKVVDLQKFLTEADAQNLSTSSSVHKNIVGASLQGITVVKSK
uniref:Protein orai n=1 Tax=Steinernema glaseri TaxID=37863 RepID=A0A1I7YW52_9BILA